ncbi:MAG: hypothetical protein WC341_10610 [Bacteroidales bacterium]|jgi:hypothetical protein
MEQCESKHHFNSVLSIPGIKKHQAENLDEAREIIEVCDAVIICEQNESHILNLFELIQSTRPNQTTEVVIIGNTSIKDPAPNIHLTLFPADVSITDFRNMLSNLLTNLHPETESILFFADDDLYNNPEFKKRNQQIIKRSFHSAINTKLISHIEDFNNELEKLADEFHDKGMKNFCAQLRARTVEFDTIAIDRLLTTYQNKFVNPTHNKS